MNTSLCFKHRFLWLFIGLGNLIKDGESGCDCEIWLFESGQSILWKPVLIVLVVTVLFSMEWMCKVLTK